jgi:ABC-2 type transport system ATP-binding protein
VTGATEVIVTRQLVKTFGRVRALDGLDLTVAHGDVHGFLGPNGAGKSTTIRVLLGLLRASAGTATVLDRDPWQDAVEIHRRLAYIPGDVDLWPNLTGGEAIDSLIRLRGGDPRTGERDRLVSAFDLDTRRRCRAYSKGNRQKVALVAAFAVPAELYVLDEPTSGLDPLMETVFRHEIRRVADGGATVLLSSHLLSEVEQLCSGVSIIRAGRIVESGTLDSLRHLSRTTVSYRGTAPANVRVHDVTTSGDHVSFGVDAGQVPELLRALSTQPVDGLTVQPATLEQLFMQHYGTESASDGAATAPRHRSEPR